MLRLAGLFECVEAVKLRHLFPPGTARRPAIVGWELVSNFNGVDIDLVAFRTAVETGF